MGAWSLMFGANRPPAAIINGYSANGWSAASGTNQIDSGVGAKVILSGALTANTLATLLTVTGSGVLEYASIVSIDATSRTLRMQLILDGITAFDSTSAATTAAGSGIAVVASAAALTYSAGSAFGSPSKVAYPFNTSCVIKVASSNSETNKVSIGVCYYTH